MELSLISFFIELQRAFTEGKKKKKEFFRRNGSLSRSKVGRKRNKIVLIQRKGSTRKTEVSVELHFIFFSSTSNKEVTKLLIFLYLSLKILSWISLCMNHLHMEPIIVILNVSNFLHKLPEMKREALNSHLQSYYLRQSIWMVNFRAYSHGLICRQNWTLHQIPDTFFEFYNVGLFQSTPLQKDRKINSYGKKKKKRKTKRGQKGRQKEVKVKLFCSMMKTSWFYIHLWILADIPTRGETGLNLYKGVDFLIKFPSRLAEVQSLKTECSACNHMQSYNALNATIIQGCKTKTFCCQSL